MSRPSWDKYFIAQADLVASRSTCNRKHVGAILVRNKHIIATGYNGSLPGLPHCDELICAICGHKKDQPVQLPSNKTIEPAWCPVCNAANMRGGHLIRNGHCIRTIHAEENAIAQAARLGISSEGATLYCNTYPCWGCFKMIVAAGIVEIVYKDEYSSLHAREVEETAAIIPGFTLRQYLS